MSCAVLCYAMPRCIALRYDALRAVPYRCVALRRGPLRRGAARRAVQCCVALRMSCCVDIRT
eukprot:5424031-Lingulodinium_polyedra.AAC.1